MSLEVSLNGDLEKMGTYFKEIGKTFESHSIQNDEVYVTDLKDQEYDRFDPFEKRDFSWEAYMLKLAALGRFLEDYEFEYVQDPT